MKKKLLTILNLGSRQFPVTRGELSKSLKMNDREVRKQINELRMDGYRICSTPHGSGYWIAENLEDYEAFKESYTATAKTIFEAVRAMDANIPGQIKMTEINAEEQKKTVKENISQEGGV